jgi:DNA-binding Lrp family transcriptional regulator
MSEEVGEDKTMTEASGSGKRMSDADFAEARELYELGKAGLADLAETYKISRQALSKRFKDAGAVRGSRAHEAAAAVKAAVGSGPSPTAAAAIERFADKRADWIEETRLTGIKQLKLARQLAQKVIQDAIAAGRTVSAVDDDLKAVQRFNKILCDNLQNTLDILRANEHVDEDDLPTLTLEDLTNEEILQHHKNTGALPEDATLEDMLAESAPDLDIEELDG